MPNARQDDYVDFEAFEEYIDNDSQMTFEKMSSKRHQKIKQKINSRRRIYNYLERKVLLENDRYFDFDLEDKKYH